MKIKDRIKELRRVPANELLPNPKNWRIHPESQANAMRGILSEVGIAGAVLARETEAGLMLIDGHLRAETLGDGVVPVLVLDVNEAEADKLLATFDPLSAMAEANGEKLEELLASIDTQSAELLEMLDSLAEKAVVARVESELVQDVPPPVPEVPKTQPGDTWLLGSHRLVCGDCTNLDVLQHAAGGQIAAMCFTDPPYNVDYTGKTKNALKIKGDKMDGDSFLQFLRDTFSSLATVIRPGGIIYVCHADSEGMRFRQAFTESGFLLKQCLVWVKNTLVMGRQDYHWKHEPILYGWRDGGSHKFRGGRKHTTVIENSHGITIEDQDGAACITISVEGRTLSVKVPSYEVLSDGEEQESVWRVDRPTRNADHPTMKPIALCGRAILHGTIAGEIVVDSFLGSGSTLIAAEQLGRKCFGTEMDPRYCDVIVTRWEKLTGKKAVLESN